MVHDDTVINDPDFQEQALFELFKSGSVSGVKAVNFEELAKLEDNHIVCYEVPKEVVKFGLIAGMEAFYEIVKAMPVSSQGSLVLTFSGFMGTKRPLFQEKRVVHFMRGFLFGSVDIPDIDQARKVLQVLFDERVFAFQQDGSVVEEAFEMSGAVWAVAHAFPNHLFVKDATSPSGWSRDIDLNVRLFELLLDRRVPVADVMALLADVPKGWN